MLALAGVDFSIQFQEYGIVDSLAVRPRVGDGIGCNVDFE